MPAFQISFADFALAQQAAITCAPPVSDAALVVVAHPLAVGSGECIRFDGVFSRIRGVSSLDLRSDHDWSVHPDWACGAMDAPRDFPSGSHRALSLGGRVTADAFVCHFGL